MKMIVSALFLVTLISCNGSDSKTQSKSCTYNDQPVDCDSLTSGQTSSISRPTVLKASVVSGIQVNPTEIIFLENQEDQTHAIKDGEELGCGVFTRSDEIVSYTIKGQNLTLIRENAKIVLTRQIGFGRDLRGLWSLKEKDEWGENVLSFEFLDGKVKVSQECSFK